MVDFLKNSRTEILITCFLFCLAPSVAFAQKLVEHDTSYYATYDNKITSRFYFSRKYTSIKIRNESKRYTLNYVPNTTLNMGVGATYKWATLNLAYGFGFLNPERGRGKTKYLDLQFHSYGKRIVLDVFGQFYRGFYLSPKGYGTEIDKYYLRPDLRVNLIGTSAQYVLNHRQFSYRASFLQNEWQKKTAGSLLVGLEFYAGAVKSDSTIVPSSIDKETANTNPHAINFFEIGPNIGYAHTAVIRQHFFITGSISLNLDYSHSAIKKNNGKDVANGFSPDTFFRFFAGYNSRVWAVSIVYIRDNVSVAHGKSDIQTSVNTGNYRLNFVYRFVPNKRTREILEVVD